MLVARLGVALLCRFALRFWVFWPERGACGPCAGLWNTCALGRDCRPRPSFLALPQLVATQAPRQQSLQGLQDAGTHQMPPIPAGWAGRAVRRMRCRDSCACVRTTVAHARRLRCTRLSCAGAPACMRVHCHRPAWRSAPGVLQLCRGALAEMKLLVAGLHCRACGPGHRPTPSPRRHSRRHRRQLGHLQPIYGARAGGWFKYVTEYSRHVWYAEG